MMMKFIATFLVLAIPVSITIPAAAQGDPSSVRADVERRIRDHKEKVTVELVGGEKANGRLTQASDDSLTLDERGKWRTIRYRDVTRIKGKGWSTGKKVGIFAGVGGAITGLILYIAFQNAIRDN